jgi:hypothetical protein
LVSNSLGKFPETRAIPDVSTATFRGIINK